MAYQPDHPGYSIYLDLQEYWEESWRLGDLQSLKFQWETINKRLCKKKTIKELNNNNDDNDDDVKKMLSYWR